MNQTKQIALRILVQAIAMSIFGIILPYRQGYRFLDAQVLLAYCLLTPVFTVPYVSERLQLSQDWRKELYKGVGFGAGLTMLAVALGLATVNISRHLLENPLIPGWPILAGLAVLNLGLGAAAGGATLWMTVIGRGGASVRRQMRLLLLALLVGYFVFTQAGPPALREIWEQQFDPERMPWVTSIGGAILLGLGAGLAFWGLRKKEAPATA